MSEQSASDTEYVAPLEQLEGETEVRFQCGIAAGDHFEPGDPEYCPHEPETIVLNEPAFIDERGKIHLPGRPGECPECGNPHEFRFNGVGVFFS
ncbi:hypothetical protein ACFQMA_09360 [Halosimplex aquaticum]|uniref:Uncharacterized protein n=1 Tax=Halosimplex aquaticum TaxID=3026162 RepID=A0ABD5XY27_9EURY|nr:hypothetical protein [Halosimplex aquaticum]